MRGGARTGAGRKPKSPQTKLLDGKTAKIIPASKFDGADGDIPTPSSGIDCPLYDGAKLDFKRIYNNTYNWLRSVGCDKLVPQTLIEGYAITYARFLDCEKRVSTGGYQMEAANHTRYISLYVKIGQEYRKAAVASWQLIYQIVKENAAEEFTNNSADTMERLLRTKA